MPDVTQMNSVFALLNSGSSKEEKKLLYRTLVLPKHAAKVIRHLEKLNLLKEAVDPDQKSFIVEIMNLIEKALISTTSIKGNTLAMLTTNRQIVQITDPRAKKSIISSMLQGRQHQEGSVGTE